MSLLLLLFGLAHAQIEGAWYDTQIRPYGDPHILAFGNATPGGTVTFLTPDRGQPAYLVGAFDRAPVFTIPFLGALAPLVLTNVIFIEPAQLFGSGAELYVAVPIPSYTPIGMKFRFQFITILNNVWQTSWGWEIEIH